MFVLKSSYSLWEAVTLDASASSLESIRRRDITAHTLVRALNVRKGHKFSHLDKSMKFGTDDLHAILFQNVDGSNLRF